MITEATNISAQAKGYAGSPGIHSPAQIAEWKIIARAIREHQGRSCMQLWHTGRNSHQSVQPGNAAPVAPSAISAGGRVSLRDAEGRTIRAETSFPRALETAEIPSIVEDFKQAAVNAVAAGFDFVELHGAHGYLIHQFLSAASNQRTDAYGGSLENRMRFPLQVVDAVADAIGADRVGFRIFPSGRFQGLLAALKEEPVGDTEEEALAFMGALAERHLAWLHVSEPDWTGGTPLSDAFRQRMRLAYPGIIIGAGAYTAQKAQRLLQAGYIDAAAFGRAFIANPDLPERIRAGATLAEPDKERFYGGGAEGYTDYTCLLSTESKGAWSRAQGFGMAAESHRVAARKSAQPPKSASRIGEAEWRQ